MLAERLREVRKSRRMTASRLATAARVSKSFISQLESGRTSASLATLQRIAGALGVSPGTLLAPAPPAQVVSDDGSVILHTRDMLPVTDGINLISQESTNAHAILTLLEGSTASGQGDGDPQLVAVLRGKVSLQTESGSLLVSPGDIARVSSGHYLLTNEGPGPALVLVSARSAGALPLVAADRPQRDRRNVDAGGPLRLVAMRARRAAEKAHRP
jgi:transcriptional regulator with XRE-family HTH domain